MTTKIKAAYEAAETKTFVTLIFGSPGAGKTTLALTAPNSLLIDADSGVSRLAPVHRSNYLSVSVWQDIADVLQEDLTNYNTIVIDTAGRSLDFLAAHLIKEDSKLGRKDGALTLQGYGSLKASFSNFVKQVKTLNKHLIFVAHDKEEKNGDDLIVRPDIVGGSLNILMREMDLVGYVEMVNNKRTISFNPTDKHYGKNTLGLEPLMQIPDFKVKGTFMADIFDKAKDKEIERGEFLKQYKELIENFALVLKTAKTPDNFTAISQDIEKVEHIWSSKMVIRELFKAEMTAKNIGFEKEKGFYSLEEMILKTKTKNEKSNTPAQSVPA